MSSSFVSNSEVAGRHRMGQEDWEKVQQLNDPIEAPGDRKTQYQRLEEEEKYENSHKLNNVRKGFNNVRNEYPVDEEKVELSQVMEWNGEQEPFDIRNKIEKLKNEVLDHKSQLDIKTGRVSSENSSHVSPNHLKKCVLTKVKTDLTNGKPDVMNEDAIIPEETTRECCKRKRKRCEMEYNNFNYKFQGSGLTCIGILPGLGSNIDSSDDSDQSCSSGSEGNENVKYDLLGRRIVYESKQSSESR